MSVGFSAFPPPPALSPAIPMRRFAVGEYHRVIRKVYSDSTGPTSEPAYPTRRVFPDTARIPLELDGRMVAHVAVGNLLP